MGKLTEQEIASGLKRLPHWSLDNKTIARRYPFESFKEAIQFTNAVADESEQRNHHPFIAVDYKFVTLRLTSWHAGGLTQEDIDLAIAFDELYNLNVR